MTAAGSVDPTKDSDREDDSDQLKAPSTLRSDVPLHSKVFPDWEAIKRVHADSDSARQLRSSIAAGQRAAVHTPY
jgi:hypothetical protein